MWKKSNVSEDADEDGQTLGGKSRHDVDNTDDWGIQGKEGKNGGWVQKHFEKQWKEEQSV